MTEWLWFNVPVNSL